jgi:hypothetical protein
MDNSSPTFYSLSWKKSFPTSLRFYLITSSIKSRLPLYFFSFLLASAIRSGKAPSLLTAFAISASVHYIQQCGSYLASVIIFAGSNETLKFYEWLALLEPLIEHNATNDTTVERSNSVKDKDGVGAGAIPLSSSSSSPIQKSHYTSSSIQKSHYTWLQRLFPTYLHKIFPDLPNALSTIIRQGRMIKKMLTTLRTSEIGIGKNGTRISLEIPHIFNPFNTEKIDGILFNLPLLQDRITGKKSWDTDMRALVIYFGGNGEVYEFRNDFSTWASKYGLAVLMMNYTGYAESSGSCSRFGSIRDCAAAVSFATNCLGVPSERIILLGHSIGGALASEIAKFYPSTLLINDRSFSSLSSIARHMMLPRKFWLPSTSTSVIIINKIFEYIIRYIACYEMNVTEYLSIVHRNNKIVIYHKDDSVIISPSQLYLTMDETTTIVLRMTGDKQNAHNREFNSTEMNSILNLISKFLKGQALH